MKQQILHYAGLYGDTVSSFSIGYVHLEHLEDRSNLFNWEIKEHFHSELVQFFHVTAGRGRLSTTEDTMYFEAPCLMYIPVNHLHGFVFDTEPKGTVLTLSDQLFETFLKESTSLSLLSQSVILQNFGQQSTFYDQLLPILNRIYSCSTDPHPERNIRLSALLKILFFDLTETENDGTENTLTSGYLRYFQQFQRRLRQTIHGTLRVKEYASELGISSVHLNRVCQELIGKSAGVIIQETLIREAKNYLLHSEYSISETAYLLNFHDPAHFSRFFKQHTGVSPREFRA